MPLYEYKCDQGHVFDAMQRFADAPLATCEICGAPAARILSAPAIHFKGSGFYNTDYGTRRRAKEKEAAGASSDAGSSSDTSSSSSEGSTSSAGAGTSNSGSSSGSSSTPTTSSAAKSD